MSQPLSRKSTASQSSSAGCDGASLMMPKSAADFTSPVPKVSIQKRFTVTRAVSGFSFAISHCARPSRLTGALSGILCSAVMTPAFNSSCG